MQSAPAGFIHTACVVSCYCRQLGFQPPEFERQKEIRPVPLVCFTWRLQRQWCCHDGRSSFLKRHSFNNLTGTEYIRYCTYSEWLRRVLIWNEPLFITGLTSPSEYATLHDHPANPSGPSKPFIPPWLRTIQTATACSRDCACFV